MGDWGGGSESGAPDISGAAGVATGLSGGRGMGGLSGTQGGDALGGNYPDFGGAFSGGRGPGGYSGVGMGSHPDAFGGFSGISSDPSGNVSGPGPGWGEMGMDFGFGVDTTPGIPKQTPLPVGPLNVTPATTALTGQRAIDFNKAVMNIAGKSGPTGALMDNLGMFENAVNQENMGTYSENFSGYNAGGGDLAPGSPNMYRRVTAPVGQQVAPTPTRPPFAPSYTPAPFAPLGPIAPEFVEIEKDWTKTDLRPGEIDERNAFQRKIRENAARAKELSEIDQLSTIAGLGTFNQDKLKRRGVQQRFEGVYPVYA